MKQDLAAAVATSAAPAAHGILQSAPLCPPRLGLPPLCTSNSGKSLVPADPAQLALQTHAIMSVNVCSFSSKLFSHPEAMAEEVDRAVGSSPRAGAAPARSQGHAPCFGHLGSLWGWWGCLSPGRSVAASYPFLPDGWQHMDGSAARKGRKKKLKQEGSGGHSAPSWPRPAHLLMRCPLHPGLSSCFSPLPEAPVWLNNPQNPPKSRAPGTRTTTCCADAAVFCSSAGFLARSGIAWLRTVWFHNSLENPWTGG